MRYGGADRRALVGLCLSVAGCYATPGAPAARRASKEFGCPSENIAVVQRADISESEYDVSACGQRARYACIYTGGRRGYPEVMAVVGRPIAIGIPIPVEEGEATQCIHEHDPPRWDPDPMLIASFPGPPGAAPSDLNFHRICGESRHEACLYQDNGRWRWRPPQAPSCEGSAVGLTCQ